MYKKIVIKNGKKYIVNVPTWDDGAYESGVGPGGPLGFVWMQSTDTNWYAISVSGSAPNASIYINQTSIGYADNSYGYQQLLCNNGSSYLVYLTGTSPSVTFTVSQSAFTGTGNPKPDLLLQSITDGNFYYVTLTNSGSVIQASVNQTFISNSFMSSTGY